MSKSRFLGLFVILLCGACGLIPQRLTPCSANRPCPTGFWCEPETSLCRATASSDSMSSPEPVPEPDLTQECTEDCQACQQHGDCPSQICDSYLRTGTGGTCVPKTDVVYVDNRGGVCGPGGDGETPATALCTLPEALMRIDGIRKRMIRVMPSLRDYGSLSVTDRTVAIFGPAGQGGSAELSAFGPTDGLTVSGSARVLIDGVDIGRSRAGLSCRGSSNTSVITSVAVRRSRITRNADTGIQISDCQFEADRVLLQENGGGALIVNGTRQYSVTNSFLVRNYSLNFSSVKLVSSGWGNFRFNTVAENESGFAPGVSCGGNKIEIRDSIVVRNTPVAGSQFTSCQIVNTVVGSGETRPGIRLDPVFVPVAGINFGLDPERSAACCIDQALSGLREDYFGTTRPRGLAADLGAHEAR